jgi:amino acid adenylation domain-containing protein
MAGTTDPTTIRFHQLFEQQAARLPQHLAVICNDQKLTYAELNARANQLAHHLRKLGAGPEVLIPICVDRSAAMAIGILGILKSGAAYVPIDPAYPTERIAFMLADTAAPIIVTQAPLHAQLPKTNAHVVRLDDDWIEIAAHSSDNLNINCDSENLSYVIYTSGSTGKPKGTMLTQTNLSHYVLALQAEIQLTPADRYLHLASTAFSSSRRHLLFPLAHGATVVIADEEQRLDPVPLFRLIKQRGVTVFDAVPSFQRHCTNALLELAPAQRHDLIENQLRLILSASEPLLSDIPATWKRAFNHPAEHIHMLGQTETSGIVALHRITEDDFAGQVKVVPVGHPIANTQIFLLDENQAPVRPGEAGEIYISGAGVGRGYLKRPELTAEKFIQFAVRRSPFAVKGAVNSEPQTANPLHLCRTGDFARLLPNGTLECLGRQDSQVKIRGQRVELGEIEAWLMHHANVRECVVIAHEGRLVAYLVLRDKQSLAFDELRERALRELPDYMQPAAFVRLEALPLTPNGKVDRKALPAPTETAFASAENYIAPRNQTEETLAAIWADVLGINRIGIHDHFFALGGHSLLASQIIARVRAAFQIEIPIRTIFAAPTIAGLAEQIASYQPSAMLMPPLTKAAARDVWPLSFAQQRLWFLEQWEPGTATYNLSKVVRLTGELNTVDLHQALQIIIARHDILRARFEVMNGQPSVIITESISLDLPIVDLRDWPSAAREEEVRRISTANAETPFNLACAPLLRVTLIKLSETEHQLVIVFHHIISDGWSVAVFLQELGTLYQAAQTGQKAHLPALPIQYTDYALWQQQQLQGAAVQEQLHFWQQHLASAPALLALPTDYPRPPQQRYQGAQVAALLPATLHHQLQALSQRAGVTLFMTLLAAWQVLLARLAQQDQLVVGTPIAGRTQLETEPLLGFFVNTLALRGDLAGNPTFLELLARTREAALGAYAHQDLPFEKLVEELQPARSLQYAPIFQVMFALQNAPRAQMQWGTIQLATVKLASQTAKFDLSLDVYETEAGLEAWLEFDTDLFTPETATRFLQQWQVILESVIHNPAQCIQDLPWSKPLEQPSEGWQQPVVIAPIRRESAKEQGAPQTGTEATIAQIWAELLRVNRIERNDDFFDLGGHSLLALKVIARLQRAFAVRLSVRKIFETPTVAGLAAAVDELLAPLAGESDLDVLLAELDALSEEEAQRLIVEAAQNISYAT